MTYAPDNVAHCRRLSLNHKTLAGNTKSRGPPRFRGRNRVAGCTDGILFAVQQNCPAPADGWITPSLDRVIHDNVTAARGYNVIAADCGNAIVLESESGRATKRVFNNTARLSCRTTAGQCFKTHTFWNGRDRRDPAVPKGVVNDTAGLNPPMDYVRREVTLSGPAGCLH